jgi:PAS domain S-box-containing protein
VHSSDILFNTHPLPVCVIRNNTLIAVNPAFRRSFGIDEHADAELPAAAFGLQRFCEEQAGSLAAGAVKDIPVLLTGLGGSALECMVTASEVQYAGRRSLLLIISAGDEQAGGEEDPVPAQLYRLALEQAGIGFWEWNVRTGTVYCSPVLLRFTGEDDGDITALAASAYPEDLPQIETIREKVQKGLTEQFEIVYRVLRKDHSLIWVMSRGELLKDSESRRERWIGTVTDISYLIREKGKRRLFEQDLLSAAISTVGVAITITDSAGNVVLMNTLAEQFAGEKASVLYGRPFSEVFRLRHAVSQEPVAGIVEEALRTGETLTRISRYRLIADDGTQRIVAGSVNLMRSAGGEITGAVASFQDHTREYSLEQEIEDVLRIIPDMFCIADREGTFIRVNHAFKDVLGYRRDELEGKNISEFIHPGDLERSKVYYSHVFMGTADPHFVSRFTHKDGRQQHIEWSSAVGADGYVYSSENLAQRLALLV